MSMRQIRAANIASIPERAATTLANVRQAERKARRFIKDNYPGVTDIGVGRGWGVSFTRDAYGNETFHRAPDYMVVIVVESRSQCPDPKRGTLFLFGNDGLRTPSQFLYKRAR